MMRMCISRLFIVTIMLVTALQLKAYDCKVDKIYYNLLDSEAIVTNGEPIVAMTDGPLSSAYEGEIVIPRMITVEGNTYNVTTIGDNAFCGCRNLYAVVVPSSVKSIHKRAFYNCKGLVSVSSRILEPFDIASNVFEGISSDAILYVPIGTKSAYQITAGWSAFKSIEENLFDGDTFTAFTEEEIEMEFKIINSTEKTCKVIGIDYQATGNVTIPSEANSFKVIEIGNVAFGKCSNITSVKIPETVLAIGEHAFSGCSSLSVVNLPNSLTTIGIGAFQACESLKSIVIPSSVTSIECLSPSGYWEPPFSNCKNLESIVVEPGNPVYDSRENCNAIITETSYFSSYAAINKTVTIIAGCKNTTIPSSVPTIGGYAFAGCGLTQIEIPSSIQYVGNNAFYGNYIEKDQFINHSDLDAANNNYWGCTILDTTKDGLWITNGKLIKYTGNESEIIIPSSVTSINDYVFSGLDFITSVTIPNSVTKIGNGAFYRCSSLRSIKVPNGITEIGNNMFNGCSSLETVTIPYDVKTIGGSAFAGCKNLREVYCYPAICPETGANVFSDSNIANATLYVLETANSLYKSTTPWSDFGSLQNLDVAIVQSDYTFTANTVDGIQMRFRITDFQNKTAEVYGYYVSRTATLKEYFPAISRDASKAVIPSSVYTNNGEYKITGISSYAFYGCKLTCISIPSSLSSIGYQAFKECNSLKKVIIPDIASWCSVIFKTNNNGRYEDSNPLECSNHIYSDEDTEIIELIIPEGVVNISAHVFCGCKNIQSIKIPESLKRIGVNAFYGCEGLSKVIVKDIASWCAIDFEDTPLNYAHHLFSDKDIEYTELIIPDDVKKINKYAFHGAYGLRKFYIPDGLEFADEYAFPENLYVVYYNNMPVEQRTHIVYFVNKGSLGLLSIWNYLSRVYGVRRENQDAYDIKDKSTRLVTPALSITTTQTTATIKVSGIYDGFVYKLNDKLLESDEIKLTELEPDYYRHITLRVSLSGIAEYIASYTCEAELKTKAISPFVNVDEPTASSISAVGSYIHGDAHVIKQSMKLNDLSVEGASIKAMGLTPNHTYSVVYTIDVAYGENEQSVRSYSSSANVSTAEFKFISQAPKVISAGNVIVSAETNLDDEETNVGFEWRRTDWSDNFVSNTGNAYLFEGTMEGYIRNLNTEKLWQYRPYYLSNSGTYYYGDWIGIDPTNISYFEPTVHTYGKTVIQGNTALVKGYALQGTDGIKVQGLKYWKRATNVKAWTNKSQAGKDIPTEANIVEASGQVMLASLENLDYETEYNFIAFVTTSKNETFYGELQTFKTDEPSQDVIDGIILNEELRVKNEEFAAAMYDLKGRKLSVPQKGFNIIRYSDGTTRKVLIK